MKPKRVALLIETSSSWGNQIILGVSDYMRTHDRWVLYVDHRGSFDRQSVPTWWEGEGIIARVLSPALAQHTRIEKVPCVNVSQVRVPGALVQNVTSDEISIGRLAAEALLRTASRYYGYYGPPKRDHYTDQLGATYIKVVGDAGYKVSVMHPDRVLRSDTTPHFNLKQLTEWIESLEKPCAILAWNALGAFRLLEACAWAGLSVPDDVRILGGEFDDLLTQISQPKLSVIDHNARAVGYRAAEELDRLMAGGTISPDVFIPNSGLIPGETLPREGANQTLVQRASAIMLERLAQPLPVVELAESLGVSRRTLELHFQEAIGTSPADKLRRLRVERACELLTQTDQPIQAIASACGFTAVELLQRAMQKQVGMTPSKYRRHAKIAPSSTGGAVTTPANAM